MNTLEKRAWYTLAVIAVTLAVYLPVGFAAGFGGASLGSLGIFGCVGGVVLIGRREKAAGRTIFDERDSEINRVATLAGYSAFWIALVLGVMIPFFHLGPSTEISLPAYVFPTLLMLAWMIILAVRALVTVVLYRKGSHA